MEIVKTARVEVIRFKELHIGDYILWSSLRCKVVQLIPEIRILQFGDDEKSVMTIPKYSQFYRMLDYESKILCNCCFVNEVKEEGQSCKECKEMEEKQ